MTTIHDEEKIKEKTRKRYTMHGLNGTSIYNTWHNITARCHNKNDPQYKNYGGRGIRNHWKKDFTGFFEYVSRLPNYGVKGMSLDRIDNDRGYEPNNLRWATHEQQHNNTRRNIIYCGETAKQASIRLGGCVWLVSSRLRYGWTKERAFTQPVANTKEVTNLEQLKK